MFRCQLHCKLIRREKAEVLIVQSPLKGRRLLTTMNQYTQKAFIHTRADEYHTIDEREKQLLLADSVLHTILLQQIQIMKRPSGRGALWGRRFHPHTLRNSRSDGCTGSIVINPRFKHTRYSFLPVLASLFIADISSCFLLCVRFLNRFFSLLRLPLHCKCSVALSLVYDPFAAINGKYQFLRRYVVIFIRQLFVCLLFGR